MMGAAINQPHDHFSQLATLLALEADAEKEQALANNRLQDEAGGRLLTKLIIREEEMGLGERYLLTLGKRNRSLSLPWHQFRVGTPILLREETAVAGQGWRGIVSKLQSDSIQIACAQWPETDADTFRLDISYDEVTRQRQEAALQRVSAARGDRLSDLRAVLLGQQPAYFDAIQPLTPLNTQLNESQITAVAFALAANDVAIIHGPPGTGKTTAVVELIRQAIRRGQKVLACAPSNLAVDNLFERLLDAGETAVRLGHPARVLPALRDHTLDHLVEQHPDVRVARQLAREARQLQAQANRYTRAKPAPGSKRALRDEAKQLLREARQIEAQTVERILHSATVLCATASSLDQQILGERQFDLVVLDEASQSTEPLSWLPVLWGNTLVLAGDHCQLPPTVISQRAQAKGLDVSLMERLMGLNDAALSRRLTIQYRMNQAIMGFSAAEFYADDLQADETVATHLLADLTGVAVGDLTTTAVTFIDTAGASYDEVAELDGDSRFNPQEAVLVGRQVTALAELGVPLADIGVIAPYGAQVRLLRDQLPEAVEVGTVDGFQGREKEAIIISLTRANERREIGFLRETRRMNVALTRARRKLIVIGDSATITADPFYERLIAYFEQIGAYRSVWEMSGEW